MSKYKMNFAYTANSARELNLEKDEIVTVLKTDESGWAEGISDTSGNQGWFPISYAQPFAVSSQSAVAKNSIKVEKKGRRMSTRFFGQGGKKEKDGTPATANTTSEVEEESGDSILNNKQKTTNYLAKWMPNRVKPEKIKGLDDQVYNAPGSTKNQSNTLYGTDLYMVLMKYGSPIPPIVEQCVDLIRRTAMDEQGIFRISGMASDVDNLGREFADPNAKPQLDSLDCNAVAGACKKFFRELPEPLFTFEAHEAFLAATQSDDKVSALKAELQKLPRENYLIIHYLMKFLHEVSQHAEVNKMAASNLGIVFGPTLMRNKEESLSGMMNPLNNPAGTIAALVEHFHEIFGPDPDDLLVPSKPTAGPESTGAAKPPKPLPPTKKADDGNAAIGASSGIREIPKPASPGPRSRLSLTLGNPNTGGGAGTGPGTGPGISMQELLRNSRSKTQSSGSPGASSPPNHTSSTTTTTTTTTTNTGSAAPSIGQLKAALANGPKSTSSLLGGGFPPTVTPTPASTQPPPVLAPKPSIPIKPQMPVASPSPPAIAPKPSIPPKPTTEAGKPPIPEKPMLPPKPTAKEYCIALYDYKGEPELGQMSFTEGQRIEIKSKDPSGWWTSDTGLLFPSNFMEVKMEIVG